jgi:hypothetical protein
MRERNRLGALQVCERGQDGCTVDVRSLDEDCLQVGSALDQRKGVGAAPESKSGCHLIVAGAPGVHAATDVAQLGNQLALNQGMHVLICGAGVDRDGIECLHDRGGVIRRNDALPSEHPSVRLRSRDVVWQ